MYRFVIHNTYVLGGEEGTCTDTAHFSINFSNASRRSTKDNNMNQQHQLCSLFKTAKTAMNPLVSL
jgi:hypothetical protein